MWTVYMHTHKESGKKYIGITNQDVRKRWLNGKGYKPTTRFRNAIDKYGWDMFEHEVLFDNLTQEEAFQMEIALIAKYHTTDKLYGYNNSVGGEAGALGSHYKQSAETIRKRSETNKGKKHSAEARALMSESRRGENNVNWGKHFSEEHRGKIGSALSKEVVCTNDGATYASLREASESTGVSQASISRNCNGQQKYAGRLPDGTKLHWRYKTE